MSAGWIESLAFVGPLATVAALSAWRRPDARRRTGMLLAAAWVFATVPPLNAIAVQGGWWRFGPTAGAEMPVALLIGWVLLWGLLPALALPRAPIWLAAALALWLDLMLMPRLTPLLTLGPRWLAGEALLIGASFIPARVLAELTTRGEQLYVRAVLQVACFGALVLWTLPWAVEAAVRSQSPALDVRFAAPVSLGIALQVVALPALLGVAAVHEFALRGGGTPVPYDPPARLVRSGPYAYVANPMQLSAALVLVTWGALTGRPWVIAIGVMSVFYAAGLAEADEAEDLRERFGEPWAAYRRGVRAWLPRWRPWHPSLDGAPPDVLYVSAECGKCSELGRMVEAMRPIGLVVVAAEEHPARDLGRITYAPADGGAEEEGVAALARALEHVNLALALPAMAMRLPIIRPVLQVIVDASGGGPVEVSRRRECIVPSASVN